VRNIIGGIKLKCLMKYVELYQYIIQEVTTAIPVICNLRIWASIFLM